MKLMKSVINGKECKLVEVEPKHFEYIIRWRNDSENRKYLNQPNLLTMELQYKWYEAYRKDDKQILYIMLDENNTPFGTISASNIDEKVKTAETGRLVVEKNYRGTIAMAKCMAYFYVEAFKIVDTLYGSIRMENKKSFKISHAFGFKISAQDLPMQECQKCYDDLIGITLNKQDFESSQLYQNIVERL